MTKGDSENKVVVPESYKPVYKELIKCENGSELKTTILHLAAENNFYEIARKYLLLYPNSVCRKDFPQKSNPRRIPVEIALDRKHDKICSLLMKSMLNERFVRCTLIFLVQQALWSVYLCVSIFIITNFVNFVMII